MTTFQLRQLVRMRIEKILHDHVGATDIELVIPPVNIFNLEMMKVNKKWKLVAIPGVINDLRAHSQLNLGHQ